MELSEYFNRIFPSTDTQKYYPNRKNNGIFVSFCFIEAGSNYFSHKQGDRLKSEDVPLERKLYDGSRKMSSDLKDSFAFFNEDGLCAYFEKIIDNNKYTDIMLAFAIPPSTKKNPQALRRALAVQFKAFIESDMEDADDIVAMAYQQILDEPNQVKNSFHHVSSLYPDDIVYFKPEHKRSYSGYMYEMVKVTWQFSNLGKQTWVGRKLYLANHGEIRPRVESTYVEIPDTPPMQGVMVSTVIELRPFEGHTTCKWIMVDKDENDCFPGSGIFNIDIDVKFKRKNS